MTEKDYEKATELKEGEQALPLEEALSRLEGLARKLEEKDTSLEESFILYQEGMKLLKYCSEKLDTVEKKMLQLTEDGTVHEF